MNEVRVFIKRSQVYAKAIITAVGGILVTLTGFSSQLGVEVLSAEVQGWVTLVLAALTAYSVWRVPNLDPTKGSRTLGPQGAVYDNWPGQPLVAEPRTSGGSKK